uniref:Factor interacting with PAPOLA and CPSF1 n=1 Tax=Homo sapiens TaxID=9606 RepID=A0A994J6R9_HUMAN
MSAGEVERLVSELSGGTGGDEEEEWLYGVLILHLELKMKLLKMVYQNRK